MAGGHTLNLIVAVIAIGVAGALALVLDWLKASNEKLRAANLELQLRRDEEHQRTSDALRKLRETPPPAPPRSRPRPQEAIPQPAGEASFEDARRVARDLLGARAKRAEVIPIQSAAAEGYPLPSGFHPYAALTGLLEAGTPLHALVIAVGVKSYANKRSTDGAANVDPVFEAAESHIRRISSPHEFAAPAGNASFIIVTPDQGGKAQSRFEDFANQMWNFRLREDDDPDDLLACAAVEARGETLAEAVEGALERLELNRRSGQYPVLETSYRRQAG